MTDWKNIAEARGLRLPEEQLDRTVSVLESIEKSMSEIRLALPDDLGMAVDYMAEQK